MIYVVDSKEINDIITCVTANERSILVGRKNGSVYRYTLPHITLQHKMFLEQTRPAKIAINCNSTCFSVIDL